MNVTFEVGQYDSSRPLVIDPVVLSYSTYLGGRAPDAAYAVAVDNNGNAYVAGEGGVPLVDPFQGYAGKQEVFVSKFSPDGSTLLYSTYFGGGEYDWVRGIAVDSAGAMYITGTTTSNDLPTTPGAYDPDGSDVSPFINWDAYVAKFSPDGSALEYSTYLGGRRTDGAIALAIDATGSAYVTGATNSRNFPTVNAVQPVYGGGYCEFGGYCYDTFVTKLNPAGSALAFSTYLGGNQNDSYINGAGGIAVDSNGHAYVTGITGSANFPLHKPFQTTFLFGEAFIAKLTPEGSAFVFSTYLGGSGGDNAFALALDTAGNAYITGSTGSEDFPTTPDSFQPTLNGEADAFITKIEGDGSALLYSTYLGGSFDPFAANDRAMALAVDDKGSAYVTGRTPNPDFPTLNAFQPTFQLSEDAFVTKLTPDGKALVYSSFLGGNGQEDFGYGIAVTRFGEAVVVGKTSSTNFPTFKAFQPTHGGAYTDAFVTKISRYLVEPAKFKPIP